MDSLLYIFTKNTDTYLKHFVEEILILESIFITKKCYTSTTNCSVAITQLIITTWNRILLNTYQIPPAPSTIVYCQ